jgi:hypothetical protein
MYNKGSPCYRLLEEHETVLNPSDGVDVEMKEEKLSVCTHVSPLTVRKQYRVLNLLKIWQSLNILKGGIV